ncbi:hypothetical protein SAMD00023353_6200350 [Rosellinia necatrix]|uniref:Uncharacterized protein n=1 Tax=Rosellinia necatrix TaxID=77044 RepID=A0A1S8AAH1_ROSNE|nr:hypothetical protein SAMD00023353_6200350 [Rosellinia necatrix]
MSITTSYPSNEGSSTTSITDVTIYTEGTVTDISEPSNPNPFPFIPEPITIWSLSNLATLPYFEEDRPDRVITNPTLLMPSQGQQATSRYDELPVPGIGVAGSRMGMAVVLRSMQDELLFGVGAWAEG